MIDTFVTQSQLVSFQPIKSVHDHRLIFEPINQINVIQLRYLNSVLFPLVYKDHFYAEVLKMECFCQLGIDLAYFPFSLPFFLNSIIIIFSIFTFS